MGDTPIYPDRRNDGAANIERWELDFPSGGFVKQGLSFGQVGIHQLVNEVPCD
jgi:hypothetical protein